MAKLQAGDFEIIFQDRDGNPIQTDFELLPLSLSPSLAPRFDTEVARTMHTRAILSPLLDQSPLYEGWHAPLYPGRHVQDLDAIMAELVVLENRPLQLDLAPARHCPGYVSRRYQIGLAVILILLYLLVHFLGLTG